MQNTSRTSLRKATALLLCLASLATTRLAAQAVSNLSEGSTATLLPVGSAYEVRSVLTSFTTGSSATSFDFTGIDVVFQNSTGSASGLTINLYGPGMNLSDISTGVDFLTGLTLSSGSPVSAGTSSFLGSATLSANTTYYLLFQADGTFGTFNSYTLGVPSTGNQSGYPGWTISDGSEVYFNSTSHSSSAPVTFAVYATEATSAVPEPSTYAALAGAAALGLAIWRRSRRRTV